MDIVEYNIFMYQNGKRICLRCNEWRTEKNEVFTIITNKCNKDIIAKGFIYLNNILCMFSQKIFFIYSIKYGKIGQSKSPLPLSLV